MSIQEIIEEQFGFKNQDDFLKYYKEICDGTREVTEEEFDRLNPDKIDNTEFWEYLDSNFDKAICGGVSVNHEKIRAPKDNHEACKSNIVLNAMSGVLNYFIAMNIQNSPREFDVHVLEIGSGLGSGKFLVPSHKVVYHGIDVVPRFEGVIQTDGNGFPPELKDGRKFHHVFSCNVFQHLSRKQRLQYYSDIYDSLSDHSFFSLATQFDTPRGYKSFHYKGQHHICHYGQFTPIQTFEETIDDVVGENRFRVIHTGSRADGFGLIVFSKNPRE